MATIKQQIPGGYHKGDTHSGGGGGKGAGGKKTRPERGWEKGDLVRDVDDSESPFQVPAKPGRKWLLQDSPDVIRARRSQRREALKDQAAILPVTIRTQGLTLTERSKRMVRDQIRDLMDGIEEAQSAIVTFQQFKDHDLAIVCEIKVKLKRAETARVAFGDPDLHDAFMGAAKRLPGMVKDNLRAIKKKLNPNQRGPHISKWFRPAKILGHILLLK